MRKKIKYLMQEDVDKLCQKYSTTENFCDGCPLLDPQYSFINNCQNFEQEMTSHLKAMEKSVEIPAEIIAVRDE